MGKFDFPINTPFSIYISYDLRLCACSRTGEQTRKRKELMRTISVDEAQVGDVLAEALDDGQGKMLLPKGSKLSPAAISLLKRREIRELNVEGEDPDAVDAAKVLEDLDFRFSDLEEDALMMEIKKIARGHLAKK